ncbi:MAG: hypothetical protein IIB66_03895 [Proteobacteria bacterium]|nr:hypothetical protein [Pseudomonadota bacterium]
MTGKLSEKVDKKLKERKEDRNKKEQENSRILKTMKEKLDLLKKTLRKEGLLDLISKYPDIKFRETEQSVSFTYENISYGIFLIEHNQMFEATITLNDGRQATVTNLTLDDQRILDDLADHLARMIELINNKQ